LLSSHAVNSVATDLEVGEEPNQNDDGDGYA
jgi:hypothetical protein